MPNAAGVVQKNAMNVTEGRHIHNYSTFKDSLSYKFYNTLRFGEYTPSFEMEGVERDEISLNTKDIIDSLSLKAPFKGSIRKIKESFKVPNMAILPQNWDKIYVQPSNGDDVPDDANCILENFPSRFAEFFGASVSGSSPMAKDVSYEGILSVFPYVNELTSSDTAEFIAWINGVMRALVLGEYVYSAGSLLHVSGYRASGQFMYSDVQLGADASNIQVNISYDAFFDKVVTSIFSHIKAFNILIPDGNGNFRRCSVNGLGAYNERYAPFRYYLELIRENPFVHIDPSSLWTFTESTFAELLSAMQEIFTFENAKPDIDSIDVSRVSFVLPKVESNSYIDGDITEPNPNCLNLSRLLAYQLVCAHFFTNSSIDFIYSAELYRQYIYNLYQKYALNVSEGVGVAFHFEWNGQVLPYDYLSERFLLGLLLPSSGAYPDDGVGISLSGLPEVLMSIPSSVDDAGTYGLYFLTAWAAIFGYRKSLRYGDYFVASRPRPLAPINTDVAVNDGMVSVIDVTRKIQAQRFGNAIMRSRQKIENYVNSLFGKSPAPDFHNPFFLSREAEIIYGDEVQNTAESQQTDANSRTANFAAGLGQFTFTFHNDDNHPCIYLQIISFDVRRAYTQSVDRQFLHVNRYDMFNPDFQYIGDQPVYGIELGYPIREEGDFKIPYVFSYQGRDMEFKQKYDVASGGFLENLPAWIMDDKWRGVISPGYIDPDFIRSWSFELDKFFLSLTGYSLGSYFHFICITHNNVFAKRAMAVDPQILA